MVTVRARKFRAKPFGKEKTDERKVNGVFPDGRRSDHGGGSLGGPGGLLVVLHEAGGHVGVLGLYVDVLEEVVVHTLKIDI